MSFRIHSQSPELRRELEARLAELNGQIDEGFEYEVTAKLVPREQALARAGELARSADAESVFVADGTLAPEITPQPEASQEDDPDFAMGLPPVSDEQQAVEMPPTPLQTGSPRIDAQRIKDAAAARASQARATFKQAGTHTGAALKTAGEQAGHWMRGAGKWAAKKSGEVKAFGREVGSHLAAKSAEWKASFAARSAQRHERRQIESQAREERRRAAHREAELAAISAQIMLEQQKQEEKKRLAVAAPQRRPLIKPVVEPVSPKQEQQSRDPWPVWRSAFAGAACMALIAVFLLAGSGKQSGATPATSTELAKPAVVVPSHTAEQPAAPAVTPQPVTKIVEKPAPKPAARKRVAPRDDEEDSFQEVTVRHYSKASPLARPKKNANGVVQISDME